MRRIAVSVTLLLAAAACGRHPAPAASPSRDPFVEPSASASASASIGPPSPPSPTAALPPGVPASYGQNVASGDVPLDALVPKDAIVDGSWYATTPAGEAIVVAYEEPSDDPFRAARGLVVWRRFDSTPFWRATFGLSHDADEGVLNVGVLVADVTGDGSDDALVMESTGGSGACGMWRVLDLAANAQVWKDELCDAQVVPSADPVGLSLTGSVFKPGDSHCCPSATRTTVLIYAGEARWTVASKVTTPLT